MASAPKAPVRKPDAPFYFNTSEHLLRIGRYKANNLSELLQAMQACPEDCIFQHTFRTLQEHHFIRQGFSNDFAHWSLPPAMNRNWRSAWLGLTCGTLPRSRAFVTE
jgi:uncharacterized protein DUF5752